MLSDMIVFPTVEMAHDFAVIAKSRPEVEDVKVFNTESRTAVQLQADSHIESNSAFNMIADEIFHQFMASMNLPHRVISHH